MSSISNQGTRRLLFILVLFILNDFAQAQNLPILNVNRRAGLEFDKFSYVNAKNLYMESFLQDSTQIEVISQIARCYLKLNNSVEAERWLKKLVETDSAQSDDIYYALAQQLSKNAKYEETAEVLRKLNEGKARDFRAESLARLDEFFASSMLYKVTSLDINSKRSDFGPMYYGDRIAYLSARQKNRWIDFNFSWDATEFLNFYSFSPGDSLDDVKPIADLNGAYHEGPGQLYDNDQKIVFTRNHVIKNKLGRQEDGISKLQLYFATRSEDESWLDIQPFEHNITSYSFGHPTINPSGDTLIFASDIPGGYGGTDLYFSVAQDSGWSVPANLGERINTQGNEMFPFLEGERLYFASDFWPGLGGLDVFVINPWGDSGKPVNLGAPINSSQDDFGLITDETFSSGYFSSDRMGNDDIYSFQSQFYTLSGVVKDLISGAPVDGSNVIFLDSLGRVFESVNTGMSNTFSINSTYTGTLIAFPVKSGLLVQDSLRIHIDPDFKGTKKIELFLFVPDLEIKILDESGQEIAQAVYYLKSIDAHKTLQPAKSEHVYEVTPGETYELFAAADGFYSKRDTFQVSGDYKGQGEHVVRLKKVVVGESIRLDHIYYDVNSADLRAESEVELDKVVGFMTDNPHLKIELGSHTDSRGSDAYNLRLSQKRAESATQYLINQGIDKTRITPKGYGESKPVNRCVNGVNCSAEEHQENRRTEIKIL